MLEQKQPEQDFQGKKKKFKLQPRQYDLEKTLIIRKDKTREISEKILFTGLDNSGKTSIIKVLQKEISQIAMLKPTRQAQRKIFEYLGRDISEWDLGGQLKYRIAYLKEPTKYFDRSNVCIYVIDIQDRGRMEESMSYFSDVIKEFRKLEISPLIYIFFHKTDPTYAKNEGIHLEGLISQLKDEIRNIVEEEFNVSFSNTTIYDLWTIISSFSDLLLKIFPQSELLDKTIQEFALSLEKENACNAILVLDSNSLVIGQYFENEESKQILTKSTPYFLTLNDSLEDDVQGEQSMVIERGNKRFYTDQFRIKRATEPLFLIVMTPKKGEHLLREKVDSFITLLQGII
jgi:GTPase SAR1 family protein